MSEDEKNYIDIKWKREYDLFHIKQIGIIYI